MRKLSIMNWLVLFTRVCSKIVLLVLLVLLLVSKSVSAQDTVVWQTPVKLYETQGDIVTLMLLSDQTGNTHLFWVERSTNLMHEQNDTAIYYMINETGEWSAPIDVLAARGTERMEQLRGLIDPYGRIHLVYGGVNEWLAYARSLTSNPTSAQSWLPPITVSEQIQTGGSIALGTDTVLRIVHSTAQSYIYHYTSSDWGDSWPDTSFSASPPSFGRGRGGALSAVGADGTVHVTWSEVPYPEAYPPLGSWYVNSFDGGMSWSIPTQLAPENHAVSSMLCDGDADVHVFYIGRVGVPGRYHRWSADSGLTWSEPLLVSAKGAGLSGGDLAMDSAGILHAIFGIGDGVIAHSEWAGSQWSTPNRLNEGVIGAQEIMLLEITQGNHIHVVWESDHQSIWYVEGIAAAPQLETEAFLPLPFFEEQITPLPESSFDLTPIGQPSVPQVFAESTPGGLNTSATIIILCASGFSFLVVGSVILWKLKNSRR